MATDPIDIACVLVVVILLTSFIKFVEFSYN